MTRWARQKLALDGKTEAERQMAKLTLHLDYPGQKRESNGQFGTGKKAGGSSNGGSATRKSSKKPAVKKPRRPNILPRERAALHSELNTHLTEAERSKGIVTKNLFGALYTVEINGFDEYNVIKRVKADETRAEYVKEFKQGGKKK